MQLVMGSDATCRRLLALGNAVLAVRSAKDAVEAFASGGDDPYGGAPTAAVLAGAAGAARLGDGPLAVLKRLDEALEWPAAGGGSSARVCQETSYFLEVFNSIFIFMTSARWWVVRC